MCDEEDARLGELFSLLGVLGAERLEADYDEFGTVLNMRYFTPDGIQLAEGALQLPDARAVRLCNSMILTGGAYFPDAGTFHLNGSRRRYWFVR